jgi:hypothetical protein
MLPTLMHKTEIWSDYSEEQQQLRQGLEIKVAKTKRNYSTKS